MKKAVLSLIIAVFCFEIAAAAELDKWDVFKSTHFFIYYKNAPESFISEISDKSEEYYDNIANDLGFNRFNFWLWDDRAKIYIYNDAGDYRAITGQPEWSLGLALPRDKIIRTFIGAKSFLETTLPHEIGHIIFREFVGFNNPAIPLWLDEGVASYQEKLKYALANEAIRRAMAKDTFMDLMELFKFQINPEKNNANEPIDLFYLESFSLVDFLIKKSGRDTFVYFCQNLRDKKDFERALSSSYNFSNLQELDQAWQEYVKKA